MHFKKAQKFDKNFKFHSAYNNFVPICILKKKKKSMQYCSSHKFLVLLYKR